MFAKLLKFFISRPKSTFFGTLFICLFLSFFAFKLSVDASAESLLLEDDTDLKTFREISKHYKSDNFLLLAFKPYDEKPFSNENLAKLKKLHEELEKAPLVERVFSIINAPLLQSSQNTDLKELLKTYFQISDRLLIKLKNNRKIFVNGNFAFVNMGLNVGDNISIFIDFIENNSNIVPNAIPLDIVYEDDALLIINKLAGIPVHPSMEHYTDSLSNGVRFYFDSIGLKKKIRPVNRLDKNTSGIVIFAKNEYIQESLIRQMENGVFTKEYLAIVVGDMSSLKKRNN